MLILAGLGNPGAQYAHNRHNLGMLALNAIAKRWGFPAERSRFFSLTTEGSVPTPQGPVRVLLLKPQTFYNESGRAVGEALKFFKLTPADVIVFYDEIDLAPGRFRMKTGGGAAGNNGIRSLTASLFAGCFLGAVFLGPLWKKVVLVAAAGTLALGMNFLRSLFLTGWAYGHGTRAVEGPVHDAAGYAVLALTVTGLFGLVALLNRPARGSLPRAATGRTPATGRS